MEGDILHPVLGHTVIRADSARRYIEYLRSMSNAELLEHATTMRHVAGLHTPAWAAESWELSQCLLELERRKLAI